MLGCNITSEELTSLSHTLVFLKGMKFLESQRLEAQQYSVLVKYIFQSDGEASQKENVLASRN